MPQHSEWRVTLAFLQQGKSPTGYEWKMTMNINFERLLKKCEIRNGENGINKLEILYWLVSRYIWPRAHRTPYLCPSTLYAYGADLLNYWSEKSGMSGAIWFKFFMSIEIFCWLYILFFLFFHFISFHSVNVCLRFFLLYLNQLLSFFCDVVHCVHFGCPRASLHSSCLFWIYSSSFHFTRRWNIIHCLVFIWSVDLLSLAWWFHTVFYCYH